MNYRFEVFKANFIVARALGSQTRVLMLVLSYIPTPPFFVCV